MKNEEIVARVRALVKSYNEAYEGLFTRFEPNYSKIRKEKLKLQAELTTELRKILSLQ